MKSRVAAGAVTPLVVLDKAWGTARVLTGEGDQQSLDWMAAGFGNMVSVLPMRLNGDGLDDLVILSNGAKQLQVVETQSAETFIVNLESDEKDFSTAPDSMGVVHCDIDNDPENGDNCTLRAALEQANANPDSNTIFFSVDDVIVEKALPHILHQVTIDGMEPKEGRSEEKVDIDGGSRLEVFNIDAGAAGSVVRGMVLRANFGSAIRVLADNVTIEGNYIATDPSGMIPMSLGLNHGIVLRGSNSTVGGASPEARNILGNGVGIDGGTGNTVLNNYIGTDADGLKALGSFTKQGSRVCGVTIAGSGNDGINDEVPKTTDNTIGSLESTKAGILGNLISGNFCGVEVRNAPGNLILGNWIGTDRSGGQRIQSSDGTPAQGNIVDGIDVQFSNRTQIRRNVVVASRRHGIHLQGVSGATVSANNVGVDVSGTAWDPDGEPDSGDELGNNAGILLEGSDQNTIGGTSAGDGNLVGANRSVGLHLTSSGGNDLWGNQIGANKDGLELGNRGPGVTIAGDGNTVGGDDTNQPNFIAFNASEGIRIFAGAQDTVVKGNRIVFNQQDGISIDRPSTGTTISGNAINANGSAGIRIEGSNNLVGGVGIESAPNTISFNMGPGVVIANQSAGFAQDNAVVLNQIFGNGVLGIDLGDDGPTENDPPGPDPEPGQVPDADEGPNALQNFPILRELGDQGLSGVLLSKPSTLYRLEFYDSRNCEGRGQGAELLAIKFDAVGNETRTDDKGRLDFSLPLVLPFDTAVTATATKVSDELKLLATSEFSPCISRVRRPALVVNSLRDGDDDGRTSNDMTAGDGICSTGGTISRDEEDEPECTLRAAIEEANAVTGPDRIHFNLPESTAGPLSPRYKVLLASALPAVTDQLEMDGFTQPGSDPSSGSQEIEIDGGARPDNLTSMIPIGVRIRAGHSLIRGLSIRGFTIAIQVQDGDSTEIRGNWIRDVVTGITLTETSEGNSIGAKVASPAPSVAFLSPAGEELVCADPCNRIEAYLDVPVDLGGAIVVFGGGNTVAGNIVEKMGHAVAAIAVSGSNNQIGGDGALGNRIISERRAIWVADSDNSIIGNLMEISLTFVATGVYVREDADRVTILSNIFGEVGKLRPIELAESQKDSDGYYEDPADWERKGANRQQNHGSLHNAARGPETLLVRGSLRSEEGEDYTIQLYAIEPEGEARPIHTFSRPIGTGPDPRFLGFLVELPAELVPDGHSLASTVTDGEGNTSEFSKSIDVQPDADGDGVGSALDPDDDRPDIISFVNSAGVPMVLETDAAAIALILVLVGTTSDVLLGEMGQQEYVLTTGLLQTIQRLTGAAGPLGAEASSSTVQMSLPSGMIVDSYFNYGPTPDHLEDHFYEFLFDGQTGAEIFEDRILLHYVDGGRGDHDLTVNGEIQTWGGPATLARRFYFPQVGDGLVANIHLQTSLVLQNTRAVTPVELELFNSESDSLTLDLDSLGPGSLFGFGLNPGESVSARSSGIGDIQAGYAEILAAAGVGGTAVFSRSDAASGTLLYEAGVPATQPLTDFTLFVDSLGDRETGLAVAFPTAGQEVLDPAELTLRLYDNEFNELASTNAELLPGRHFARFITQFFSETPGIDEMQGTVTVSSTEPVVAVTLRQTDDPQRGFPEDVPILTTFPVIPARADLGLAGQGDTETIFFPQIGNGIVADIRLQTELIFVNASLDEADLTLEFFDSTGGVQAISLTNGETDSRFELNLGTGQALTLETDGAGAIQVGYARITGPAGLGGTAVFRRSDDPSGTLLYEAGVPASKTLSDFSLVVDNRGARDTGLAIVVPPSTESPAHVTIRLYDTEFNLLAEDMLDLAPGSHLPRFASELFPEVEGLDNLEGTLTISTTQPITAITIRQNDEPALQFPAEVPTLATFPVIPGRSEGIIPSRR